MNKINPLIHNYLCGMVFSELVYEGNPEEIQISRKNNVKGYIYFGIDINKHTNIIKINTQKLNLDYIVNKLSYELSKIHLGDIEKNLGSNYASFYFGRILEDIGYEKPYRYGTSCNETYYLKKFEQ